MLPWRIKNFLSERFPLAYHLAVNLGAGGNDQVHWDQRLADTWELRTWPTKNSRIVELTCKDDRILDIACGNGSVMRALKDAGYTNLSGLEISQYAVKRLEAEGFAMYLVSVPTLPIPDCKFDVVIASQILEHVIRRGHFMSEVQRVLTPGGRAFVFVPDDCLGPIDEPEHVIKYTKSTLSRFLARHFDVLSIESMKDDNHSMSILFAQVRKFRPEVLS
jgi:SAM-dependent methyltransferase